MLLIHEEEIGQVRFEIAEEEARGWQLVRGKLHGDPAVLRRAKERGYVSLRHDATGFTMTLMVADMAAEDVANVTVDVSDHTRA